MAPARSTKWNPKYVTPSLLTTPPGLVHKARHSAKSLPIPPPPPLPSPPGLEAFEEEGSSVRISGLPNHLLSNAMMGATLDQAQLDQDVLRFVTRPGMGRGEVIVTLKDVDAAMRCAQHFHGRRWDASGIMVTAELMNQEVDQCQPIQSDGYGGRYAEDDLVADPHLDDLKLLSKYEARIDREGGWDDKNLETFGVDCCDHDDLLSQVFASDKKSTHSSMLSASAPAFVPGKMQTALVSETATVGSDVSTEDGDSASSCDEKDSAVAVAKIPWQ